MFYENQEQLHGSTRKKKVYKIPCLSFGLIVTGPHLWPAFWALSYPWYFLLCEFSLFERTLLVDNRNRKYLFRSLVILIFPSNANCQFHFSKTLPCIWALIDIPFSGTCSCTWGALVGCVGKASFSLSATRSTYMLLIQVTCYMPSPAIARLAGLLLWPWWWQQEWKLWQADSTLIYFSIPLDVMKHIRMVLESEWRPARLEMGVIRSLWDPLAS